MPGIKQVYRKNCNPKPFDSNIFGKNTNEPMFINIKSLKPLLT